MTTTKIIVNSIYFTVLILALLLDIDNYHIYYLAVFAIVQIIFIWAEYIITNRVIPSEAELVKSNSPFTLRDLLFVIPLIIVLSIAFNLFFKLFTTTYLVAYIAIGVISAIIQFVIIRDKKTATFLINQDNLVLNELILRTYNLQTLSSIAFNGFEDRYGFVFANGNSLTIRQSDYSTGDLNQFIAVMISKSKCKVEVSENIKVEINSANI